MTGVRVALDSNVAVAILNQQSAAVQRYQAEGRVALPVTVAGELLFGVAKSQLREANRKRYHDFIRVAKLVVTDLIVAEHYGNLKLQLHRVGKPIPENDLWIAAACLAHGLVLVTNDAHFSHCPGLLTENWLVPHHSQEEP